MSKICYFLYVLIGLVMYFAWLYFILFFIHTLDQFQWTPDIVSDAIAVGNRWLEQGQADAPFTLPSIHILRFIAFIFMSLFMPPIILIYNKKTYDFEALTMLENECIPLTTQERLRCEKIITLKSVNMKHNSLDIRAYAYGSNIAISQGALDKCNDEELAGIVAHEIGHTKSSYFKQVAIQARLFYLFLYKFIKGMITFFWDFLFKLFLIIGPMVVAYFWIINEDGGIGMLWVIGGMLFLLWGLVYWYGRSNSIGQKKMKSEIAEQFSTITDRLGEELSSITLGVIKFFFYHLPMGWLINKADDFDEYSADDYALGIGNGKALLQALLHVQKENESKPKGDKSKLIGRSRRLLRRRIRRLEKHLSQV